MQKIFTVDKIREADNYTIAHEPISSLALMERAASAAVDFVKQRVPRGAHFFILCGPGNNGGDGLAMARMLAQEQYVVEVAIINISNKFSPDFVSNRKRLGTMDIGVQEWSAPPQSWPKLSADTFIIDAILGSGLTKPLSGFVAQLVKWINESDNITLSVDIATGLYADKPNDYRKDTVVCPDYTISFQFAKLAFMIPENDRWVGEWHAVDIGLSPTYISQTATPFAMLDSVFVSSLIRPRHKFMHKGQAGHLMMIAGSYGKMGAALLSAKAAMRAGVGLLSLHHPANMHVSLITALPELMSDEDNSSQCFTQLPKQLEQYDAVGIGPGLGTAAESVKAFKLLLQAYRRPMLIDADALNILADNPTYLHFIPAHSVLTPHVGELHRLLGSCHNAYQRIDKARAFAQKYQLILLIKGAHTAIVTPAGQVIFNSTGNAGMATAGAGDVLSGIIAALLAQAYDPTEAAMLAVFLHGLAGDIALTTNTLQSMVASDIVDKIGAAYQMLTN